VQSPRCPQRRVFPTSASCALASSSRRRKAPLHCDAVLIPPPRLDEELWVCIRRRWRKGLVVAVKRKTLRLVLLRPMPEDPLMKEVSAGWAYVTTEHELRREPPTTDIAAEWTSPESVPPPTMTTTARRARRVTPDS
jgi:hypothetical protein